MELGLATGGGYLVSALIQSLLLVALVALCEFLGNDKSSSLSACVNFLNCFYDVIDVSRVYLIFLEKE